MQLSVNSSQVWYLNVDIVNEKISQKECQFLIGMVLKQKMYVDIVNEKICVNSSQVWYLNYKKSNTYTKRFSCQFLIGMVLKHDEFSETNFIEIVSIPHRYGT